METKSRALQIPTETPRWLNEQTAEEKVERQKDFHPSPDILIGFRIRNSIKRKFTQIILYIVHPLLFLKKIPVRKFEDVTTLHPLKGISTPRSELREKMGKLLLQVILDFPSGFVLGVVTPLNLAKLDHLPAGNSRFPKS